MGLFNVMNSIICVMIILLLVHVVFCSYKCKKKIKALKINDSYYFYFNGLKTDNLIKWKKIFDNFKIHKNTSMFSIENKSQEYSFNAAYVIFNECNRKYTINNIIDNDIIYSNLKSIKNKNKFDEFIEKWFDYDIVQVKKVQPPKVDSDIDDSSIVIRRQKELSKVIPKKTKPKVPDVVVNRNVVFSSLNRRNDDNDDNDENVSEDNTSENIDQQVNALDQPDINLVNNINSSNENITVEENNVNNENNVLKTPTGLMQDSQMIFSRSNVNRYATI